MAELQIKKYLDFEGLKKYDELIKSLILETKGDIDAAISLAAQRIAKLENIVGDGQIAELGEDVKNLTMAVLGEARRARKAEADLADLIQSVSNEFEWGQLGGQSNG